MQVHVKFIGLCLLVQRDGKQVHLLMPRAGHGASGGRGHHPPHHGRGAAVPRHHTVLCFDAAHLATCAAGLSRVPASASLDGVVLQLGEAGGQPDASEALTLINVSELTGRTVRGSALEVAPADSDYLSCRVSLQSGKAGGLEGGVCWTIPGQPKPMVLPHILHWTFTAPDEPLQLDIDINGGMLPPLHAIGGKIKLRIMHAIAADHLPKPPQVTVPSADHFGHLYDLLEPPAHGQAGPLPEYHPNDSECKSELPKPVFGGSPFNCMLAQGDPP